MRVSRGSGVGVGRDKTTDPVATAEKEYLLEYYSLIREGKTAYVSSLAFMQIFGEKPQEIPDFFKAYAVGVAQYRI